MRIKRHISLRVSILSIYALTFIFLMSLLILIESWTFLRAISELSFNRLEEVSSRVIYEIKSKGIAPDTISHLTKALLENGFVDENQMMEYSLYAAKYTTHFQLDKPTRISVWIDSKGNSVSTFQEPDGTYSSAIIKPYQIPPIHSHYYRNAQNIIIKNVSIPIVDLRTLHRYQDAVKAGRFIWTDAYNSPPHNNLTTTALTPIYNKSGNLLGVFNIDLKLEGLSEFLETLKIGKHGIAFLINGKNQLIAFPGMQDWIKKNSDLSKPIPLSALNKPWVEAAFQKFNQVHQSKFSFDYAGETYVASFILLPEKDPLIAAYQWKVGVVIPESDFSDTFEKQNSLMILLGIAIVLFGIILASLLSKLITTRLKMLVDETEKIKNFYFEGKIIKSIIKEVHLLAKAIHSMKNNLRSFKKYMPSTLVRQLIQSGQDIHLGGDIKTLSILFSDIKNFTNIAEMTAPDKLMTDLSQYLDTISQIISSTQGTIDKFIGDSIMAFWSAPLPDEDHCEHACRAALLCKKKIDQLNSTWIAQNKAPYITRFGVHTGEVIVGNVGSVERMNYTAIGDTINVTSRLEELNKIYGTSIIVSDRVMIISKEKFIFRKLDEVILKGKTKAHVIYELLAEKGTSLPFDLRAYENDFQKGFASYQDQDWKKAIHYFRKALEIYPLDSVSRLFIDRCKYFQKNPPEEDWNGVWDLN